MVNVVNQDYNTSSTTSATPWMTPIKIKPLHSNYPDPLKEALGSRQTPNTVVQGIQRFFPDDLLSINAEKTGARKLSEQLKSDG